MTPIKFRAWDTKQLIMIAPYGQYASQHLCRLVADILFSPDYTKTEHPYLFQQYTGLAASDGREIYEGDILYCKDRHGGNGVVERYQSGRYFRRVTTFHDNGKPKERSRWTELHQWDKQTNIMGNIYENPDLFVEPKETQVVER